MTSTTSTSTPSSVRSGLFPAAVFHSFQPSVSAGACLPAALSRRGWLSYLAGSFRPGIVATLLATAVVLYDIVLKQTAIAPLVMGSCRFLNVLLGMSLAETTDTMLPRAWTAAEWTIAAGIGIYIMGVTIFARTEARETPRLKLATGLTVMASGIVVLAAGAAHVGNDSRYRWIVWLVIGAFVIVRHSASILSARAPRNSAIDPHGIANTDLPGRRRRVRSSAPLGRLRC